MVQVGASDLGHNKPFGGNVKTRYVWKNRGFSGISAREYSEAHIRFIAYERFKYR